MCLVYANRQFYLSMIGYVIWGVLMYNIREVYTGTGQDPEVADFATQFVHGLYPCYFLETLANVYNNGYAMNCKVMHYMVISLFCGSIVYLSAMHYFINVREMTFDGVVYASQLMLCTRGLVAFGCVKFGGRLPSFDDVYLFSSETVSNLSELI